MPSLLKTAKSADSWLPSAERRKIQTLDQCFLKERTIIFSDGKKLNLCGDATLKNFSHEDAYLGLWATKDTMAKIEALPVWKGFVVVTWVPADAVEWAQSNAVTVIYDDGKG